MPKIDPTTATAAEAEKSCRRISGVVLRDLDSLTAPASCQKDYWMEQLSFLQSRENFRTFAGLLGRGDEVGAAVFARALFEEAARWAWVDEARDDRRVAFANTAAHSHDLIARAAADAEIAVENFFGPQVAHELLPRSDGGLRFPNFERLLGWMPQSGMHYLQYRLLSQYTHGSLLSAASSCEEREGSLVDTRRLPMAARLTVVRSAVSSAFFIIDWCRPGLLGQKQSVEVIAGRVFNAAKRIAELTYPHAPGTA